jgi:hypothetical protein
MDTRNLLQMKYEQAREFCANAALVLSPSGFLDEQFGTLSRHEGPTIRSVVLAGAYGCVAFLTVNALIHMAPGTGPAIPHGMTIATVTQFVADLHYWDPVRDEAKPFFSGLSGVTLLLMSGASVQLALKSYQVALKGYRDARACAEIAVTVKALLSRFSASLYESTMALYRGIRGILRLRSARRKDN